MKKPWGNWVLALVFVLIALGACDVTSTVGPIAPAPTPTPCGLRCAPPIREPANAKTFQSQDFNLVYPDNWSVQSQDSSSVTLETEIKVQGTTLGIFEVKVSSGKVANGTSASQLLSSVEQNFDTSQLAGIQDDGPIYGAEIGYTAGAGETFEATYSAPNAPSAPVFIDFMTSTRGTTGLAFIVVSTINPNANNPADVVQAVNAWFDQLANGVVW
jgi:hypothetical protein